ncbi:MAG: hypothetical protein ABGW69_01040 [Nanoarchaeota archaeon]
MKAWKKKVALFLIGIATLNFASAFYFLLGDVKLNINILEAPVKTFINLDNYYSSDTVEVLQADQRVNKNGIMLDSNLTNKNEILIPITVEDDRTMRSPLIFNLNISSNVSDSSNLLEVWLTELKSSCSDNETYFGTVYAGSTKVAVCGIKKFTDNDTSSTYFNTVQYITNSSLKYNTIPILIRSNPLYEGNFSVTIKAKVEDTI